MPQHSLKLSGSLAIVALMVVATGCQAPPDKLVFDNYSLVRQAASARADVASLLGEPNHQLGDTWLYERPERHLTVLIEFDDDGRVERKQWVDAGEEVWDDSAE